MKLENEKIRNEKLYRVGYIPSIDKYVMACVVTWVAWNDEYFEITEEEYNLFGTESLDELANKLCNQGSGSPRFLFSDKSEENTKEQQKLRDKVISES